MAVQLANDIIKRALSSGTILSERYRIEHVLGEGGFGITYAGRQIERGQKVAIKEYFPAELASRENADSNQNLHIFRGEKEIEFEKGRKRFLREAEVLREFQYLDGIVTVMDYFECNHTAYIVMEYIEGITLKQYVRDNGALSFAEIIELLAPVIKSMIQIHKKDLIHRDISPDNLLIGLDNKARLIDFGAANWVKDKNKMQTVILKTGFAPPEQYLATGKQGPWTDVYAFSAMMLFALTGEMPIDSIARLQGDTLQQIDWQKFGVEEWQISAIHKGMALKVSERFKNLEEFYTALTVKHLKEDVVTVHPGVTAKEIDQRIQQLNKTQFQMKKWFWGILIFLVLLGAVWMFIDATKTRDETKQDDTNGSISNQVDANVTIPESDTVNKVCTMPDVVNQSEEIAKKRIRAIDEAIIIKIERQYHDKVTNGTVISQNVDAGTTYNSGAIEEVILVVSMGVKPTEASTESQKRQDKSVEDKTIEEDFQYTEEDDYDEFNLGE